jgi:hypothetical protein
MALAILTTAYGTLNGYIEQSMERKMLFFGIITPMGIAKSFVEMVAQTPNPSPRILLPFVGVPVIHGLLYTAGKQVGAGLKDAVDLK